MPKISVIVPCYNVAPYLTRCLDSLIEQTLHDIEIICIDDQSTDNTLDILNKYAKVDKRITVIAQKRNVGVASARNAGLDIATGEYIGFVDPDDYVDLDFYEKLYNRAIETGADVTKGSVITTDAVSGVTDLHWGVKLVKKHIAYFSSAFWSAIYKHNFLRKHNIRFPDGLKTAEDAVFLTQVGVNTKNIVFVDDTNYHYFYRRPDSLDSNFINHAKAKSASTAIDMIYNIVVNANLKHADFVKHMDNHFAGHLKHELGKQFEQESDKAALFALMAEKYKQNRRIKSSLKKRFRNNEIRCIKCGDFALYCDIIERRQKRYYLFGLLPIIKQTSYTRDTYVKLLDIFPLLKIRDNRKFYLFNCILILKIKG